MNNPVSDVWICLPAYNEGSVLAKVIEEVRTAGFRHICVVDDGSADDTALVAARNGALAVSHPINRGAGAAVMTAITLARRRAWPLVAFMDADGQHLPEDIRALYNRMETTGADLIIGSRFLPSPAPRPLHRIPRPRRMLNRLANLMTNLFCRHRYTDSQSGMRLLNARALAALDLRIDGYGFCSEMLYLAERRGLRVAETPISVRYTAYSTGKGQDLQRGFGTALSFLYNLLMR